MVASLRELRGRIKSVQATKKITRAMELIAASRIVKAQQRAQAAAPYARELTRAVSAVATYSNVDHYLTTEPVDPDRAAVLVVTSDRGLAGAYSSSVLREAERLVEKLKGEGKAVDLYVTGRKGVAYYSFRQRPVVKSWVGFSDTPTLRRRPRDRRHPDRGLHRQRDARPRSTRCTWSTRASSRCSSRSPRRCDCCRWRSSRARPSPKTTTCCRCTSSSPRPPRCSTRCLPRYVTSRIFYCLLQASASELAARQRAMKSATDNAEELIKKYTRTANQARQAGITQEISEIVGGVNALADANAGSE